MFLNNTIYVSNTDFILLFKLDNNDTLTHVHTHTLIRQHQFILSPYYYYGWLLGNIKIVKINMSLHVSFVVLFKNLLKNYVFVLLSSMLSKNNNLNVVLNMSLTVRPKK